MVIWRPPLVQLLFAELLLLALASGAAEPVDINRRASETGSEDDFTNGLDNGTDADTGDIRTTTFQLGSTVQNQNTTVTTVTTTVTTRFSCPVPSALDRSGLLEYTSCIKSNCEEMDSTVLQEASTGLITNCFLLLEAAGGCAGDASIEVPDLRNLGKRFEVGDLCGRLCPSHCQDPDQASETTSSHRSITTSETPSGIFEEEDEDGLDEQDSSTSQPPETTPTTTLDLVASAGRLRVLISSLTFRISNPEGFGKQTGIRKALRDGIAASLVVSPAQVVILDVEVPSAEGKATSAQVDGNLRRLQVQGNGIRVPFEILNAPHFLDVNLLLDKSTTDAMEVHLKLLFEAVGVMGTISDLQLEEPQILFREVTKKETTVDEWFFTYPVDTKIGSQMEPLEPGITNSGTGRPSVTAALLAGLFGLCTIGVNLGP